jgi:energy-coupling factor transport system ATP-binding protein
MKHGIVICDVSFYYQTNREALSHIDLTIKPGLFVGISGSNGSGKTTLSYLINGLIPHSIPGRMSGAVFIDNVDTKTKSVSFFSKSVGMVFQNPDFSLFNLTVGDEIAFGLKNLNGHADKKDIRESLNSVGLEGYEDRDPQTLSFGEKQKVCLASVLALNVSYIILDEPTAMLDWQSSVSLYRLLHRLNESGKTIIVIEHDTDFLLTYASDILLLDRGQIASFGPTREVFADRKKLRKLRIKAPNKIFYE